MTIINNETHIAKDIERVNSLKPNSLDLLDFNITVAKKNFEAGINIPNLSTSQTQSEIIARMELKITLKNYIRNPNKTRNVDEIKTIIDAAIRLEEVLKGKHMYAKDGVDYLTTEFLKVRTRYYLLGKKGKFKAINGFYRTEANENTLDHLVKLLGNKSARTTIHCWNQVIPDEPLSNITIPLNNTANILIDEKAKEFEVNSRKLFKKAKLRETNKVSALLYSAALINRARNKGLFLAHNSIESWKKEIKKDALNQLTHAEKELLDILVEHVVRTENIFLSVNKLGDLTIVNADSVDQNTFQYAYGKPIKY